jgi:hypothetical protein
MPQTFDEYTGVSEHDARHLQQEYLATLAEFQRLVIEFHYQVIFNVFQLIQKLT